MKIKLSETQSLIVEGNMVSVINHSTDPPKISRKYQFDSAPVETEVKVEAVSPNRAIITYDNEIVLVLVVGDVIVYEYPLHDNKILKQNWRKYYASNS